MTLEQFWNDISTFGEFTYFCGENGYEDFCDCIISGDDLSSCIDTDIEECIRWESWTFVRDSLNGIEEGYEYYYRNGIFDYDPLTDDELYDLKNNFVEYVGEDFFDSEESEEEEPEFDLDAVDETVIIGEAVMTQEEIDRESASVFERFITESMLI